MNATEYGRMGTTFSIIFLAVNFANAGAASTIPTFLNNFISNRKNFRVLFINYLLIQVFILLIAAIFTYKILFFGATGQSVLLSIIVIEGIRIILRTFLHTIFYNKSTILIDSLTFILYLFLIWIPYFIFNTPLTFNLIFTQYLITSFLGLTLFLISLGLFYKTLPENDFYKPENLLLRILKARFYNYAIRFTRYIYTGNFLVPLFAYHFGLEQAGILKFASSLSESIKSILNIAIGLPSGAVLALLKNKSLDDKKNIFNILSKKLNNILYFIAIFLIINLKPLLNLNNNIYNPQSLLFFALFFLILTLLENLLIIYEQFYIIEEYSDKLLIFKILELILFAMVVFLNQITPPLFIFINIALVQLVNFAIIATSSYHLWKITQKIKISLKFSITSILISGAIYYILSLSKGVFIK